MPTASPHARRATRLPRLAALAAAILAGGEVRGAGPPVLVSADPGADAALAKKVRAAVASRRAIRDDVALPKAASESPERAATAARAASIRLALARAERAESEAAWSECVREAAGALSDAVEVLARTSDLALLRDLYAQMGACMTLDQRAANARPHFVAAALLDESEPPKGRHREEAEAAFASARAEVLARSRGKVRVETTPPGAEVWIDGKRAPGTTPLEVDVRLGDHFVTARRFRFEPHTERTVLQPSGVVRIALDPAQRATLRDQLAAVAAGTAVRPPPEEMLLGRAIWARAEQVVVLSPDGSGVQVRVLDAATGQTVRSKAVPAGADDDGVRRAACEALGETCEAKRGIPWYVWPIAGAAVIGGVVSTTFVVNANRDYRFCPPRGAGTELPLRGVTPRRRAPRRGAGTAPARGSRDCRRSWSESSP